MIQKRNKCYNKSSIQQDFVLLYQLWVIQHIVFQTLLRIITIEYKLA